MSPPLGVFCKHHPSAGSPLAPGSFPWRKNGKNAVDLRDGIGLGMPSIDHPIKRDDLLKDIPDNKAFFSCADDCAKSHLKWAEALRIRVVFGIRELLRRFGYFWAPKVTNKFYREIFHYAGGFPNMESTYLAPIPFCKPPRLPKKLYAWHKKKATIFVALQNNIFEY